MNDVDYCQTVLDVTQSLDHFIELAENDDDRVTIDCTLAGIASIILERLSEPFLDDFLSQFKDLKLEVARNMDAWEEDLLRLNMGGANNGHNDEENKAD